MKTAYYVRVSSVGQKLDSQLPDLEAHAKSQENVEFYTDKASGKKMDRPNFNRMMEQVRAGLVSKIVVWRLDRLGRTAKGLTELFSELIERKVTLVSMRDGIDLLTPAGRLIANVLASVSQYETEVRAERVASGIAAAKAKGKKWGGRPKGSFHKVKPADREFVLSSNLTVTEMSRRTKLSRPTIYAILEAGK